MSLLLFSEQAQYLGHHPCSLVLPFLLSRLQFPACCSPWFIAQQIVPADRAYGAPAELRRWASLNIPMFQERQLHLLSQNQSELFSFLLGPLISVFYAVLTNQPKVLHMFSEALPFYLLRITPGQFFAHH